MRRLRCTAAAPMVAALLVLGTAAVAAQEAAESTAPPAPAEPFAALLSGSVTFELLEQPTDECPLGVRTITDATGSSTLGEVTLHAEHCPTVGLPTVPAGAQAILTAEGDELSGAYFVDCIPVMPTAASGQSITCRGRFEVAGGTGRFAAAKGSINETAFVWFPGSLESQGWPWLAKLEGAIEY